MKFALKLAAIVTLLVVVMIGGVAGVAALVFWLTGIQMLAVLLGVAFEIFFIIFTIAFVSEKGWF